MKIKHTVLIITLLFYSCGLTERNTNLKTPILLADREAPLGWIYLRVYADSTFEFESRGIRTSTIYSGRAKITKDSIFFHYNNLIPSAGDKAVYNEKYVVYTGGKYTERVKIEFNNLIEQ